MTQVTISLDNESAQILKQAAKKNAKQFNEYIQDLLQWYAMREIDPLFHWKPLKGSGKDIRHSARNHNLLLYVKKR